MCSLLPAAHPYVSSRIHVTVVSPEVSSWGSTSYSCTRDLDTDPGYLRETAHERKHIFVCEI